MKGKKLRLVSNTDENIEGIDFTVFHDLADLQNKSLGQIKDEFCIFEVKNLMQKISKVIIRQSIKERDLERSLFNCESLSVCRVETSPNYLKTVTKINKKLDKRLPMGALVDFPFGEGFLKSKLISIKDSVKMGAESVTVMMPFNCLDGENLKNFKKEGQKICKQAKTEIGIAFSAMDLNEDRIKNLFKVCEKIKLNFITLVFGNVNFYELTEKMQVINKYRNKTAINVLADVATIDAVKELLYLNVDKILTPFADKIGMELIEKFNIKGILTK